MDADLGVRHDLLDARADVWEKHPRRLRTGLATFTKAALFVFAFVGIFAVLFSGITTEFYASQGAYTASVGLSKDVAGRFDLANVTIYGQSGDGNMTYPWSSYHDHPEAPQHQMGLPAGQYFEVWFSPHEQSLVKTLEFRHTTEVWWGLDHIFMEIFDANGEYIDQRFNEYEANLTDYWDSTVNASVLQTKFPVSSSILIGFNQSEYANIEEAWDAGKLNYVVSYEMNQNASMMSIWGLMGALLTFNSPALGLTGWGGRLLNALIAIPFWVITVILILKLVFAIIPFVKGIDE